MKIGVLSDTHDQVEFIQAAILKFNSEQVDLVVHCGDWVSPFILPLFQSLQAPMKGVFGNNDGDKFRHLVYQRKLHLDLVVEDRFLDFEIADKRIAVFHGDYSGIVDALVTCGKYDLVLHGHTHQPVNARHGKTLSLNPGSLMKRTSDQVHGCSIALYDTAVHEARHITL